MRLPKQWKHWCRKAGLRLHGTKPSKYARNKWAWFYLEGRGYVWRVNDKGMFQRGDTCIEFDRWALCDIDEVNLPTTEREFVAAVSSLLK